MTLKVLTKNKKTRRNDFEGAKYAHQQTQADVNELHNLCLVLLLIIFRFNLTTNHFGISLNSRAPQNLGNYNYQYIPFCFRDFQDLFGVKDDVYI